VSAHVQTSVDITTSEFQVSEEGHYSQNATLAVRYAVNLHGGRGDRSVKIV
jgi:hypothetical protein